MMSRFLPALVAAAAFAPAAVADAPATGLPPVVLHVKPLGPILEDVRAWAKTLGGPAVTRMIDDGIKQTLGDKGFDGLDLTRPVVGYALPGWASAKAGETPFVIAVPVTSEDAFLALLTRANKGQAKAVPVEGKKGLYKLPPATPVGSKAKADKDDDAPAPKEGKPSVMRFHQRHAYVTEEANAAALDPKTLIPAGKLAIPGEEGLLAVRVYFDRFPAETRAKFAEQVEAGLKSLKDAPIPMDVPGGKEVGQKAEAMARKLMAGYVEEAKDAGEATFRVVFDSKSGEAGMEVALGAKEGTALAGEIAARKPNANRFAGVVGKDAAAGVLLSAPLFAPEIRELLGLALETGFKQGLAEGTVPESAQGLATELTEGVVRTVRAGEVDIAAGLTGPDKDGLFTAVVALSFDDTAKLEAELKKTFKAMAPDQVKELVKFDAAKSGKANVHLVKLPEGVLPPPAAKVFGDSAAAALAFAPKGVFVAFGPDPVAALKAVAAGGPKAARPLDVVVNPARLGKVATAAGGEQAAAGVAKTLGDKDESFSVLFFDLAGGKELKARIGVNVRVAAGLTPTKAGAAAAGEK